MASSFPGQPQQPTPMQTAHGHHMMNAWSMQYSLGGALQHQVSPPTHARPKGGSRQKSRQQGSSAPPPMQVKQLLGATPPQAPFGLPTAQPLMQGCSPTGSPPVYSIPQAGSLPLGMSGSHPLSLGGLDAVGMLPMGQPIAGSMGSSLPNVDTLPVATGVAGSLDAQEDDDGKDRDRRHRATVSRVGMSPMLTIPGLGEFPFAYRAVKKKPGEPRTLLAVGDVVECRLTKGNPPKAVSVRILIGTNIPLTKVSAEALSGADCLPYPVARSADNEESLQGLTPTCSEKRPEVDADTPPALCDDDCPGLLDADDEDVFDPSQDCIPLCGATADDTYNPTDLCGRGADNPWMSSPLDQLPLNSA